MSSPLILIIGAGIGGLALAQGLFRRGIDFTIFERAILSETKRQGYRLKIAGPIQSKLRDLLTDEAWEEFASTVAETNLGETTINAADASIVACRKGRVSKGTPIPWTVDRNLLRQAMMSGIEGSIQFGKEFVRYEILDDEKGVVAYFQDGTVEYGSLLVGADGARSFVRKQLLPDMKAVDTETCCIYGKTFISQELLKQFPPQHRRWLTVIRDRAPVLHSTISGDAPITLICEPIRFFNTERGIIRREVPAASIHWCLMFPQDTCGLGPVELNEALRSLPAELAIEMASQWHPSVRSLIELQDPSFTIGMRIYSADPNIEAWTPSGRVTVMGDAIHLMSVCGGVGAVAALNDAHTLVKVISEEGVSISSIGKYEEKMRDFAKVCIQRSYEVGRELLAVPDFEKCRKVDL